MTEQPRARGFHVLAKPSGAVCNLDCTYCFFLSKEMLYPGDRFRMADEMLETYIRQTIESRVGDQVTISWQGGEPTLLGLDFFRRSVAYTRAHLPPGVSVKFTMQTNGTLLDDEWCRFLAEHRFLVGLSIDGPPDMHDVYRVDKQGRGSSARVLAALERLRAHALDVNIMCTVHAANQLRGLEVYRYFRDSLGMSFIQFIPVVERVTETTVEIANKGWGERSGIEALYLNRGSHVTDRTVDPLKWGRFLADVFDEWVHHDVGRVFVQFFDAALAAWVGVPTSMCILSETCGTAVTVEHNGDLYSCDHFVEPEYLLGNIAETHMAELVASPQQQEFGLAKRDTLPAYCRRCEFRFACHGECPRNRFVNTPDGEPGLNYLCTGYKHFFGHVAGPMKMMANLLRSGRPADEVMQLLRSAASGP